jgi:rhamnosyltransferase
VTGLLVRYVYHSVSRPSTGNWRALITIRPLPVGSRVTTASIIVRCKNEENGVGPTLDGIFDQRVQPHEVIVVDSGSTDATLDIVQRYPVKLVHLPPEQWGYGRALNAGASAATGDVLVCISAHCPSATRDWLGNLLRHFEDPAIAAVWGPPVRPGRALPEPEPVIMQLPGSYQFETRLWGLSNGNSALRRSLWQEFPFDEQLPAAEDKAWGREALARGYAIVYDPAAPVWHQPHTIAAAYRRSRAINEGFVAMFPEHQLPRAEALVSLARAVRTAAVRDVRDRDLAALGHDVARFPSTVAAVLGGFVARRMRVVSGGRASIAEKRGTRRRKRQSR